jgi:hypothetical protein
MEIFFAYARILKKESERLRQKVQERGWQMPLGQRRPKTGPRSDPPEALRLASACQNTDH